MNKKTLALCVAALLWAAPARALDLAATYFSVSDSSPGTQVWNGFTGAFVPLADAGYLAWLAAGNATPTIDTAAHLLQLVQLQSSNAAQASTQSFNVGGDVIITNPAPSNVIINGAGSGATVQLPANNVANGIAFGRSMVLQNVSGFNNLVIKNFTRSATVLGPFTGSTAILCYSFGSQSITDQNGTWQCYGVVGIGQIMGSTSNDNAATGNIGEYVTSGNITGLAITSATPRNVTSIALTAGDWEVNGLISIVPAATTTLTQVEGVISLTTASLTPVETGNLMQIEGTLGTGATGSQSIPMPSTRVSIAANTTIFLNVQATFGVSTLTGGGILRARRVR